MLDQNTDRMWYVIGAVIIGAAIILILNGTMPQIFASVADSFQGVSEEAVHGISSVSENLIDVNHTRGNKTYYLNHSSGEFNTDHTSGAHYVTNYMIVDEGESYTYSTDTLVHNFRIAYYDKSKQYIDDSYVIVEGNSSKNDVVTPNGAKYARISAGGSPASLETWTFWKTE